MICSICGREFTPNKYRPAQKVCSDPDCQRKRQLENVRNWQGRNSDYYRYSQNDPTWKERHAQRSKSWREKNRDWFRHYREEHKEYRRLYMREYMRRYRASRAV